MAGSITARELVDLQADPLAFALIDVSERGEYNQHHIDGASPLPRGDLEWRIVELVPDRDAPIVLYCSDGERSRRASDPLERLGYRNVRYLEGGLEAWRNAGQPTVFGWGVRGKEYGEKLAVTRNLPHVKPGQLAEAQKQGKRFLILDSRTREEYEGGHLPGAFSVPGGELHRQIQDLRGQHGTDQPTVVVNCAGRTRSLLGTYLLQRMGLRDVVSLENGTHAWTGQGYPLEQGKDPRADYEPSQAALEAAGSFARRVRAEDRIGTTACAQLREMQQTGQLHYLIDVRLREEYGSGHVPGAFSCPLGQLAFYSEELVGIRSAPVILYSNDEGRAALAASMYLAMGIPRATILSGGLRAWRDAALALETGVPQRPIGRPKLDLSALEGLRPRWIQPEELERAIASAKRPIVLDVRGVGDYALGHIAGARWLSRSYLELRIARVVPEREAEIVLADDDGIRAPLAAATLKDLGYRNVAVLAGGVPAWHTAGREMEEGLADAPATLEVARWDLVDPFRRRNALRFTSEEITQLMDWEIALGNKYHAQGGTGHR